MAILRAVIRTSATPTFSSLTGPLKGTSSFMSPCVSPSNDSAVSKGYGQLIVLLRRKLWGDGLGFHFFQQNGVLRIQFAVGQGLDVFDCSCPLASAVPTDWTV